MISSKRTLDLEFANEALRNTWLQTLRQWKAAGTRKSDATPRGADDATRPSNILTPPGVDSDSDETESSLDERSIGSRPLMPFSIQLS